MSKAPGARDIKLIAVGNSRGIRLPKTLLQKYGWSDSLVLEETAEGIFLHGKEGDKLSWKDTYQCMAVEHEDWNDLDVTVAVARRVRRGWSRCGRSTESWLTRR